MGKLSTLRLYLHRPQHLDHPTDLYAHRVTLLNGDQLDLIEWRGTPTLFVNTASKCGFTPQYEALQELYERYHGRGLNVLGTPSGDFADQEFDDGSEIAAFCEDNYGVQFPLTERTSVREQPDSLWLDLTSQPNSGPPNWNFTKYLVDGNGRLIDHWGPMIRPDGEKIISAIERALAATEPNPAV